MDGILCVDKPQEMTSFSCCALLRRLTGEKKVGHAGTLDPMATGVLPLMFGKATRAIPLLPTHNKQYVAELQFGKRSDTLDCWGDVTETGRALPDRAAIDAVLPQFRGEIRQVPPMMSALKRDGVRLYELARQGIEVEREARPVTIHRLDLTDYDPANGVLRFVCDCSAGTYIRTLLPIETAFTVYPSVAVTAAQATRFCNGGELSTDRVGGLPTGADIVRVRDPEQRFLGLGQVADDAVRILRIFV